MTVCNTTSSYVFSTKMNLAKSSKISSWKRGSSCQGRGRDASEALPLWMDPKGLGQAGTHRLAGGGQFFEQEGNGDLQQCLPEESLAHRAAVIVVFLQGRTCERDPGSGTPLAGGRSNPSPEHSQAPQHQVLPGDGGWTVSSGFSWPCRFQPNGGSQSYLQHSLQNPLDGLAQLLLGGSLPQLLVQEGFEGVHSIVHLLKGRHTAVLVRPSQGDQSPFLHPWPMSPPQSCHGATRDGLGVVCSKSVWVQVSV